MTSAKFYESTDGFMFDHRGVHHCRVGPPTTHEVGLQGPPSDDPWSTADEVT